MTKWLKRIRATIGMGMTWAAGWAPVGVVVSMVWGFVVGLTPGANLDLWVMTMAGLGFVRGGIFSPGACSAAGSLALARMADDRELLQAGARVGDVGRTEQEVRDLLRGER